MIAGLRHDGMVAPFLIPSAIDARVFTAYLQYFAQNCVPATT